LWRQRACAECREQTIAGLDKLAELLGRPANIRMSLFCLAAESSFDIFFCVVCRNAQELDGVGKWHLQERRNATGYPAVTALPFRIEVLRDPPITAGNKADAAPESPPLPKPLAIKPRRLASIAHDNVALCVADNL